jgi:hypothetical protein
MASDDVRITRVDKRGECYIVDGVVRTEQGWRKASFTVLARDVQSMNRQQFEAFAERQLPHVHEDVRWEASQV